MFKSKPIIHILFMMVMEFMLCYAVMYGAVYACSRPDGHIMYASSASEGGDLDDVLDMAGVKYQTAFSKIDYDTRYKIKYETLRHMSVPYSYTEKEFKNIVWFGSWILFSISMFIFIIITVCAHDAGGIIASPLLCKVFCYLLTILPDSVNNPIRSRKEKRREKVSSLTSNFIKYGA